MLDDVEGEIVKAAETPGAKRQQQGGFQAGLIEKEQRRCERADQEEEDALEFDPDRVGQVFHRVASDWAASDTLPLRARTTVCQFRISDFGFPSGFGLRSSDLGSQNSDFLRAF